MSSGTLWTSVALSSAFFGDDMPDQLRRCACLRITCGSGWAGSLFTPVWLELPIVAFMDYIHPQLTKFSSLLSKSMIANESFFTIPSNVNSFSNHPLVENQQKHGIT
jgi:hypothetical protein